MTKTFKMKWLLKDRMSKFQDKREQFLLIKKFKKNLHISLNLILKLIESRFLINKTLNFFKNFHCKKIYSNTTSLHIIIKRKFI